MNKQSFKARAQRGFGMFDVMLALVIVLVIAGGVIVYFNQADDNADALATQQQLLGVVSGVKKVVSGPTYTGLTSAVLIQTKNAPSDMVNGTGATATLVNEFGGLVTVAAASYNGGTDNAFAVTFADIPTSVCNSLVSQAQTSFPLITVNAVTVKDISGGDASADVAELATNCEGTAGSVDVVFTAT